MSAREALRFKESTAPDSGWNRVKYSRSHVIDEEDDVYPNFEVDLADVIILDWSSQTKKLELQFQTLAEKWRDETLAESSMSAAAMNENYQRIIGMGPAVIPLILRDLRATQDHWFWALKMISGEDPVPSESRGHIADMTERWVRWGEQRGLL